MDLALERQLPIVGSGGLVYCGGDSPLTRPLSDLLMLGYGPKPAAEQALRGDAGPSGRQARLLSFEVPLDPFFDVFGAVAHVSTDAEAARSGVAVAPVAQGRDRYAQEVGDFGDRE